MWVNSQSGVFVKNKLVSTANKAPWQIGPSGREHFGENCCNLIVEKWNLCFFSFFNKKFDEILKIITILEQKICYMLFIIIFVSIAQTQGK